ncbi:MAG TPA: DUF1778 domain-containing protein [Leifsonia sp.]
MKTERINIRLSAEAREMLHDAAELQQQDLTSFILGPALENARAILLQDALLRLTPVEVNQIEQALEEPAAASRPLADLIRQVRASNELEAV